MTARANGEVVAGSMYWLTSRTRRSTSRSTWAVSWARRVASSAGSASCSSAPLETHFESIGSSLPPGSRRASSTTLPPTQTLRWSISGGRCFSASSRMFSPAAPRVELPAITLSIRFRLGRLAPPPPRPAPRGGLPRPAGLEPHLQLGDVVGLRFGAPDQAPDQEGDAG